MIHAYYASVSFVDAQIGKVLDELRRLELDRNTIVVLWSDNGWQLGDHGRWSKPTNYEACARITLMNFRAGNAQAPADRRLGGADRHLSFAVRTVPADSTRLSGRHEFRAPAPVARSTMEDRRVYLSDRLHDAKYPHRAIPVHPARVGPERAVRLPKRPGRGSQLAGDPASQTVLQEVQAALRAGWRKAQPATASRVREGRSGER